MHWGAATKPTVCEAANRTGLTWESWDLVHRASRKVVFNAFAIVATPKKGRAGKNGAIRKLPQQSLQGGRTLLWKPFNVNSNIYVWARNIFHFDRRTEPGGT